MLLQKYLKGRYVKRATEVRGDATEVLLHVPGKSRRFPKTDFRKGKETNMRTDILLPPVQS